MIPVISGFEGSRQPALFNATDCIAGAACVMRHTLQRKLVLHQSKSFADLSQQVLRIADVAGHLDVCCLEKVRKLAQIHRSIQLFVGACPEGSASAPFYMSRALDVTQTSGEELNYP